MAGERTVMHLPSLAGAGVGGVLWLGLATTFLRNQGEAGTERGSATATELKKGQPACRLPSFLPPSLLPSPHPPPFPSLPLSLLAQVTEPGPDPGGF